MLVETSTYSSGSSLPIQSLGEESTQGLNGSNSGLEFGLPMELISQILLQTGPVGLEASVLVNKAWRELIVNNPVLKVAADYQKVAIGPRQWAEFFRAPTPSDEEIRVAYACLPADIHEILNSSCPAFPDSGMLVNGTHMLVYVPVSVSEVEITLESLGKLLEKNLLREDRTKPGYRFIATSVLEQLNKSVEKTHWVLMTTDVLGGKYMGITGSRGKRPYQQVAMVNDLSERSGKEYVLPKTLEAVAAIIAYFLKFNRAKFLFGDAPWTYTLCEEGGVVGGFGSVGLLVNDEYSFLDIVGVAALLRFF